MKFTRNDLKVEGAAEVAHVVAYLEQLAQALKAGTAHVRQGDQQVVLGPSGVVGFSLAASDRGKRQSLTLELTWRKRSVPTSDLDLTIGSEASAPDASNGSHERHEKHEQHEQVADAVEVAGPGLADEASVITGAPGTDKGEAHEGETLHSPRGSK